MAAMAVISMAMVKIIAKIFFMGIASFIVGCIRVVSISTVLACVGGGVCTVPHPTWT
jgi:hypothetical protein